MFSSDWRPLSGVLSPRKAPPGARRFAALLAASLVLAGLAALPAQAQEVELEVTIVQVSDGGSGIADDPRARALDALLGKQLRYKSLSVLEVKRRTLPMNEIWSVPLPNGKHFVVRPIDVNDKGVLVAVDLEKSAQGDFRVIKQKPLVLGGESYRDGKLVVVLETDY